MKESSTMNRRCFIKALGAAGLGLSAMPGMAMAALTESGNRVAKTKALMDTIVTITVRGVSNTQAQEAIGAAFQSMERHIAVFDRFDSATPISQLNATGRLNDAPRELTALLTTAKNYHNATNGAFDVTVAPLVDRMHSGKDVSKTELRELLSLVDDSALKVSENSVLLGKQGMSLTTDGLAKGFIVDMAAQTLLEQGVSNYMINAGGDIRTHGESAPGRAWHVAIEDPAKHNEYPDVIAMRQGAVATSGGYERHLGLHSHLVNPHNGGSPKIRQSVSVYAPSVMQADILSTAVSLMTPDKGIALIDTLPGVECLIAAGPGALIKSRNWG